MEPNYGHIKNLTKVDGYKSCKYIFENISTLKIRFKPIVIALNFSPQCWIKEVINESPLDMLKLTELFIKNKFPPEIKKDFQKIIKYYIFSALFSVVGQQNEHFSHKFKSGSVDLDHKKAIKILVNFFKLGLKPEYDLLPLGAYCYRDQDLFINYFQMDSVILKNELILIVGNLKEEMLYLFEGYNYTYLKNIAIIFFKNKKSFSKFLYKRPYLIKNSFHNTEHKYEVVKYESGVAIFSNPLCANYSYFYKNGSLFSYKDHKRISKNDMLFEPNYFKLKDIVNIN